MASSTPTSRDCGSPSSEAGLYSTTPPETHELPLTPPGSDKRRSTPNSDVARALDLFRKHRDQLDALPRTVSIQLHPPQYCQLQKELKRESLLYRYVKDKVRWEYDWQTAILDIRMPSAVHEFFCAAFLNEISCQLSLISEKPGPAGEFASQIKNGGSSDIHLTTENGGPFQRQPDGQFQHAEADYSGVVVEVAYSQDWESLERRAWEYIQGSDGDIKAVIGIEINRVRKLSTVTLWRSHIYREDGDEQEIISVKMEICRDPFRFEDGTYEDSTKLLKLELRDFASDKLYENPKPVLCIPYSLMRKMLYDSEHRRDIRARRKQNHKKRKKRKWSKRPSPDPGGMLPADEKRFQNEENQANERIADEDEDYQPPRKRS
ncbi:hypothetical protein GGI35DRAFT_202664 [Trichoderma velutinum]